MINILIGSNGSGKTNFISLFKMLQNLIDGKLQSYVSQHGGPNMFLFCGRKKTEKINIEFYFGSNGYQFTLVPTIDDRMMFENEYFYWKTSGPLKIGTGYFESRWRTGCLNGIDNYVKPILENQKWRVYHFHDTSDTALVKQIHGINDNIDFATDARNLAAFLYRLKQSEIRSYDQIVRTIQMVAPYFDDFVLRPTLFKADSIRLEWKEVNNDTPFLAAQLSDGTLRFICLTTLLLQPIELMPETILIDEPELGLHPYAIAVLASLIKKIAIHKQIIVSTQSVELLNKFSAKDVVVVDRRDGRSTFSRLNPEHLQIWLDEDYTLGELWKRNILEGRP